MTATLAAPRPAEMPAVTIAEIASKRRKRLRFFDALVEAGCEVLALGRTALASLAESRRPDVLADRHLQAVRRQARFGAEESSAIHDCACWRRFAVIDAHAAEAQRHDAAEDGSIGTAAAAVGRIVQIVRGVNMSLSRQLAKRAAGRGRR